MNKKSILLVLPFLLANVTSKSFEPFGDLKQLAYEIELAEVKRKQARDEYICSKLGAKSYEELTQAIKANKDNIALLSVLGLALMYKISRDIEKDDQLAISQEEYDKNVKPFLCKGLFGDTTQEQIAEEIKQAPSSSKQALVFDLAKHCNCVEDSWQEYAAKHNIEIKKN